MISEKMLRSMLIAAGASRVAEDALKQFNTWISKIAEEEARVAVSRMKSDRRVTIELRDISEWGSHTL